MTLDPTKLLIVAVVALIVLGPDKLPVVMRQIGKYWNAFRSVRATVQGEVSSAISSIVDTGNLVRDTTGSQMSQVRDVFSTLRTQVQDLGATTSAPAPTNTEIDPYLTIAAAGATPVVLVGEDGQSSDRFPMIHEVGRQAFAVGSPELN